MSGDRREKIPLYFYVWALLKSVIQLSVAGASLLFIYQSNFFIPYKYDALVWSKQSLQWLYLPQGIFECVDLAMELIMLRRQKSKAHLPWDSIIHHLVSALYAFYIFLAADSLDHGFVGLAVAAISCQVIGPLYTIHRLRFHFRYLGLCLLAVQGGYRSPLAFVSILRAIQYWHEAPWAHIFICVVLANFDYRWTIWSYQQHLRLTAHFKVLDEQKASLKKGEATAASN
eukprot:TRINITY_DN13045_c0_g1_i1.p1 TRINITY_DN13045_c0_g1~~TRINITY_DN13045_c0_g1_i1.p1  ORF type:complete len:246 (-),score=41.15 TRINITY_DN13045_c0_g1_i1:63-749(-)